MTIYLATIAAGAAFLFAEWAEERMWNGGGNSTRS